MAGPGEGRYLGLDVGGSSIRAGLVTDDGCVLSTNTVASHPGGTREQVLADIDLALRPFRSERVAGLGAGFPSFGDYERGVLDSKLSAYPSMHGYPLRRHLEDLRGVPVILVPDANLLACGLLRFGEGRRLDNFLAIGLGTGTAVGLVREGRVATGTGGFPDAIARFYRRWGWPDAWRHSGYRFAEHYGVDPETAYWRASTGDAAALGIWQRVGEALANTIVRLAAETGTTACVVAGGLAAAWRFIEPSLRSRVDPAGISVVRTAMPYPSLSGAAGLFRWSLSPGLRPSESA